MIDTSGCFPFRLWMLALSALIACQSKTVDVELLTYESESNSYQFQVVTLETIENWRRLQGRATTLIGGTSLQLDYVQNRIRWQREGRPVAFSAIRSRGVYYPEDFDSLAMVSIYYNIEQSMLFFESIGMDWSELPSLETHYWPEVVEITADPYHGTVEHIDNVDNAFYLAIDERERGFYVLPFRDLQRLPLSMNTGVMAHEYTHAVFQQLVYDRIPGGERYLDMAAYNYLYAINEGIADVMAVMLTGDPAYMIHSIAERWIARDATQYIEYRQSMDYRAESSDAFEFNPYEIGAFLSSVIFEWTRRGDPEELTTRPGRNRRHQTAEAVLSAVSALGAHGGQQFSVIDFFNLLTQSCEPSERDILCEVLEQRFSIHYVHLSDCP